MSEDSAKLDAIFARLAKSAFRSRFRLDQRDRAYFERHGRAQIRVHAQAFIGERLAPGEPRNDGQQTPMRGHPVFVAQHATATCCRGCLAKWHGIERGRPLTEAEQQHVVAAILRWLDKDAERPAATATSPRSPARKRVSRGGQSLEADEPDLFSFHDRARPRKN